MSLTLNLSPSEERQLRDAAELRGVRPEELAHRLLLTELPVAASSQPGRAVREEMTEERRDWDNLTRQ